MKRYVIITYYLYFPVQLWCLWLLASIMPHEWFIKMVAMPGMLRYRAEGLALKQREVEIAEKKAALRRNHERRESAATNE